MVERNGTAANGVFRVDRAFSLLPHFFERPPYLGESPSACGKWSFSPSLALAPYFFSAKAIPASCGSGVTDLSGPAVKTSIQIVTAN